MPPVGIRRSTSKRGAGLGLWALKRLLGQVRKKTGVNLEPLILVQIPHAILVGVQLASLCTILMLRRTQNRL